MPGEAANVQRLLFWQVRVAPLFFAFLQLLRGIAQLLRGIAQLLRGIAQLLRGIACLPLSGREPGLGCGRWRVVPK